MQMRGKVFTCVNSKKKCENNSEKWGVIFPLTSAGAFSLHHCAGDAEVFEERHTQRTAEVAGEPDQLIRS